MLLEYLKLVLNGKKIRRGEWVNKDIHVGLVDGKLHIRMEDGLYHPWTISTDDLVAEDWEVYTPQSN